jgi:hypothetical protein
MNLYWDPHDCDHSRMNAVAPIITAEPQLLQLHAGEIHAIDEPDDRTIIHCDSGAVWVTQAGMHDDVVLKSGGSFCPRGGGKVILQALIATAAVSIERAA